LICPVTSWDRPWFGAGWRMGQVHVAHFERLQVRVCWHEVSRPVECVITDPVFVLTLKRAVKGYVVAFIYMVDRPYSS